MRDQGLLLNRRRKQPGVARRHEGRVAVEASNARWCSDGFEFRHDGGDRLRVTFALNYCDREPARTAMAATMSATQTSFLSLRSHPYFSLPFTYSESGVDQGTFSVVFAMRIITAWASVTGLCLCSRGSAVPWSRGHAAPRQQSNCSGACGGSREPVLHDAVESVAVGKRVKRGDSCSTALHRCHLPGKASAAFLLHRTFRLF